MDEIGNSQGSDEVADDRSKPAADKFASFLERNTKRIAYAFAITAWLTLGFVVWLTVLIGGMIILLAVILFKLTAGLQINHDIRRFLLVLQFWPDGFSSLSSAFRDEGEQVEFVASDEPLFVYAAVRVIYVIALIYLIFCSFLNMNPFTYIFYLPGNAVMAIILIGLLTLGLSWLADRRKMHGTIYSPRTLSQDERSSREGASDAENADVSEKLKGADVADAASWTGRPKTEGKP